MKKLLCILLACLLIIGAVAALPASAATDPMVNAFERLIWFETYKNGAIAHPNGFSAAIVFDEMIEDYAQNLNVDWWADGAPSFVLAEKADFEAYVNARYDMTDVMWNDVRIQEVSYWDQEVENTVTAPFFNTDEQSYIIPAVGGYGGGEPNVQYEGYVKSGNYYHVYLQIISFQEDKPTTGVEGKDFEKVELYGEEVYCIYSGHYLKHVVTYQNKILKKFKSTSETKLPSGLITADMSNTTTKKTTTTTKKAATTSKATTTTVKGGTTTTVGKKPTTTTAPAKDPVVEFTPTEEAPIAITSDGAFPTDTVVDVKPIEESKVTVKDTEKAKFARIRAYDITAICNEEAVQPDGTVTATFDIPAEFDPAKTVVLYIAGDGAVEVIKATVDAKNRTITAQLSHFSVYAVAETADEAASSNAWVWFVISGVCAVLGGSIWYCMFSRKKST